MKTVLKKMVATILSAALILSMVAVMTVAADYFPYDYKEFNLLGANEVYIEEEGAVVNFRIVPEYSVCYTFYTEQSEYDTAFNLYNSDYGCMYEDFDVSDEDKNFSVSITLYAGETYYLETYINGAVSAATYNIYSKAENVTQSFDVLSSNGVYSIFPHENINLYTANVYPENANYIGCTWSSSDENVATVDEYGNVYGVAEGTAVITATEAFGAQSSVTIEVKGYKYLPLNEYVPVNFEAEGQKDAYTFTPEINGWYIFSAETQSEVCIELLNLEYNSGEIFNLSSESDSYKTYLTRGSTYVLTTYFSNLQAGTYTLRYNVAVESISIGCSNVEADEDGILRTTVGSTANLFVKYYPENAEEEEIAWSSNDESVATVTDDGVVTFLSEDRVTIEAVSSAGHYASISCDVTYPVLNISFGETISVEFLNDATSHRIKFVPEETGLYKLSAGYLDYVAHMYVYDEAENQLFYDFGLDGNGLAAGYYFEAGRTYYFQISIETSNVTIPVTLEAAEYVTDFNFWSNSSSIYVGAVTELYVDSATEQIFEQFSWSVDDEAMATVTPISNNSARIKGLSAGTVTVTATSQTGISKSITLSVNGVETLEEDAIQSVALTEPEYSVCYKFVPTKTAIYEFYAENIESDQYLWAELTGEGGVLTYINCSPDETNVKIQCELEEGKEYYLRVYSYTEAQMNIGVTLTVGIEGVVINGGQESVSGMEGEEIILTADVSPERASFEDISWEISDYEVVGVVVTQQNRLNLRLNKEGQAVVTVTVGDFTDTITVNVTSMPTLQLDTLVTVTIAGDNEGTKFKFVPEDDGEYVFYSTGDSNPYAYLEQNGYITEDDDSGEGNNYKICYYLYAGQAYYLRNFKQEYDDSIEFSVVVSKAVSVENITLNPLEINIAQGESHSITFEVGPVNCKNEGVFWTSSNPDVVIVEEYYANGVGIRAISGGTAVITATTESGATAFITVNVKGINELVIGSANTVEITESWGSKEFVLNIEEAGVYEFYSLNYTGVCYMGIRQGYGDYSYYYSEDNGNFRFQRMLEAGQYSVIAGFSTENTGNFEVYAQKTVTPESVVINDGDSIDVYIGTSKELNVSLSPQFSNEFDIVWSSSDDSIVTVENGLVYAVGIGVATVTATLPNGNSDSITVNCVDMRALTVGSPQTVDVGLMGEQVLYRVVIEESGTYIINVNSNVYIGISFYDANMILMGDYGGGVTTSYHMEAGTYYIAFTNYTEQSGTVSCYIRKAPQVESFEIYSGSMEPLYENIGGYFTDGYYRYEYHRYLMDMRFIIRYTDGSSRICSINEYVDGIVIGYSDFQYENPWTVGGENYVYVNYLDHTIEIPVTILENPVESIVVNTAPKTDIIFGDSQYGWMGGDGYYLYWEDLSWLTFTVNYKDNTSKTFTINDAVFEYGSHYWNGQLGYAESDVITEAGVYTGTFSYMGKEAEFQFVVKVSPVAAIELVKGPDKTVFKNGYYPDFIGLQLKVTYANGEEKTITANSENLLYELDFNRGLICYIKDGDNTIWITQDWAEDGTLYKISYYDAIIDYKGIEFSDDSYTDLTINNVNITGDKMVLTVDGVTYDFAGSKFITDGVYAFGYKQTADGLLQYSVSTYTDDKGYVTGCDIYVFGGNFFLDIVSGDFNGDGAVDVRDLVAAKKASANMTEPQNKFNADMNFDGKFDASDLPLYVKYLLGVHA